MKHDVINKIIQDKGYKSYLEIGIAYGHNFQLINCENKKGVEPELIPNKKVADKTFKGTSDDFFKQNTETFDLIFIDGLHHAEQLEKDIINSYDVLNNGGMILIHDINPYNEAMTIVPRQQEQWTGTCFQVWAGIIENTKLKTEYLEDKYGLGVIHKTRAKPKEGMTLDITYADFDKDRKKWIN